MVHRSLVAMHQLVSTVRDLWRLVGDVNIGYELKVYFKLQIGVRCDSGIASIYDEAGVEIENAELLFTEEGPQFTLQSNTFVGLKFCPTQLPLYYGNINFLVE